MTTNPELPDRRQLLKDALVKMDKLQSKLDAVEQAKTEPIAITGLGCRFPGGVTDADSYWELLKNGVDAIKEVPPERSSLLSHAITDPDIPSVWYGGFLDHLDEFDPQFFGVSPREALSFDPQQRLVLEVAWEALENAGQAPDQLVGSQTGIFVGVSTNDYAQLLRAGGSDQLDVYSATGSALNAIPGRVAYTLGLNGPSVAIDTACSSSLVAIHLACQSLRSGESNLALAGGVNVILMPEAYVCFTRWGMMASNGRCKTFDEHADGFVRSEGCGILTLKRLSDAVADHDNILAVIRGSAVNQDGRSSGLTVPNGPAQQEVIRKALANAKVQPSDVSYIETHGTGTLIGDPIEVEALGAALGVGRPKDQPLTIGAVKTNIGHSESASGVAGVIKVILSLQHGEIPRHLHFHQPNPRIPWPDFPMIIPTEHMPWKPVNGRRVAGVSGFGFSGTNAHVVLEAAPTNDIIDTHAERPAHILTLSARNELALRELAGRYGTYLEKYPQISIGDLGFTVNAGRAQFPYRLAVAGANAEQMRNKLLSLYSRGDEVFTSALARPKIAFLFTGQGSHYIDMGRVLYQTQTVFRQAFDRCDASFRDYIEKPLTSVIYSDLGADGSLLDSRAYVQPALFALQYALAQLWLSWGVNPTFVVGHSLGEYAAACLAGVFSLEDAVKLVAARSRLMSQLPETGEMVVVFADEATVTTAVQPYADQVSVAVINGPQNVVISGRETGVEAVVETLKAQGIRSRKLNVAQAFHSPLIDPMLDEFEAVAKTITYHAPEIKLVSSMTGQLASATQLGSPEYWRQHIRQPVRFADAVTTLDEQGAQIYVEIGPRPTLIGIAQHVIPASEAVWLPSVRDNKDDWEQILDSLGKAYTAGVSVDWVSFDKDYLRQKVAAPTYPFQRDHYWTSTNASSVTFRAVGYSNGEKSVHPLLGTRLPLAHSPGLFIWENEINLRRLAYLDDHRVEGQPIVPATAYMEMGMAAAVEAVGELPLLITELQNLKPLFLRETESYIVQVVLHAESDQTWVFSVFSHARSQNEAVWTKHVEGKISSVSSLTPTIVADLFDPQQIIQRYPEEISGETFYRQLSAKGNQWGSTFQGVERLWRGDREALSFVRIPNQLEMDIAHYVFHPAVADLCGHVLTATISIEKSDDNRGGAFVGGGVDETRVYSHPKTSGLWCYARLRPDEPGQGQNVLIGDVAVFDEAGTLISETLGARLWYLDHNSQPAVDNVQDWFYAVDWEAQEASSSAIDIGNWLIIGDTTGVGEALVRCIQAQRGQTVAISSVAETELAAHLNEGSKWSGIIHLGSLNAAVPDKLNDANLNHALDNGIANVLSIVQRLHALNLATPPRLWLVTRGAQSVLGETVQVAQSPMWGFGRTLALEHAEYWGGLIDLDPNDTSENVAKHLWEAIGTASNGDDQQAIRNGQRYAARLVRRRFQSNAETTIRCRADGSYLITGGLGGLGLAVAHWLVENGARRLILMGRTELPPRTEWARLDASSRAARQTAAIKDLEAMGASVHLASADVGDEAQLRTFLDTYQAEGWPPIRGVIHAAGVMQYQPMLEHTVDEMRRILQPKVIGGWHLHRLLQDAPLDFFVLYSSASALLNSPLIGSYAAANTFLDGLAHYRRALGQPALSINWGNWGEAGMVVDFGRSDDTANALMQPMSTQGALEALGQVMNSDEPQIAIMSANWKRWEKLYAALNQPPFLSQLMNVQADVKAASQADFDLPLFQSSDTEFRSQLIEEFLVKQVKQVLGFGDRSLNVNESLSNLGIDSLMAVELKNRIENQVRLSIPMAQLLQGPSVVELSGILLEQSARNLDAELPVAQTEDNFEEGVL